MSYKHLIIGYGNMGKRHGECLKNLGEDFDIYDPFIPKYNALPDIGNYKSALICSPKESHKHWFERLKEIEIPVFCEKPLFDSVGDSEKWLVDQYKDRKTFVAQNWRWCSCLPKDFMHLWVEYPTAEPLDLTHFTFLFKNPSIPRKRALPGEQSSEWLIELNRIEENIGEFWRQVDVVKSKEEVRAMYKMSNMKSNNIHVNGPCNMFLYQMKHWLGVVEGKEVPVNSIETAYRDLKMLIGLKEIK